MKKMLFVFLFCFTTSSWAVLPPKYLNVPQWQSCVSHVTKGSATFVCLPRVKPSNCPIASWKALTRGRLLDRCPRCPTCGH